MGAATSPLLSKRKDREAASTHSPGMDGFFSRLGSRLLRRQSSEALRPPTAASSISSPSPLGYKKHSRSKSAPLSEAQLEIVKYRTLTSTLPALPPTPTDTASGTPSERSAEVPPATRPELQRDGSFLRSLAHHPSISALRPRGRKRSKGNSPPGTPPHTQRSILRKRSKTKSSKSLRRLAQLQQSNAVVPVPPVPERFRRTEDTASIVAGRIEIVTVDADVVSLNTPVRGGKSLPPPSAPLGAPPPTSRGTSGSPPTEVALEFGNTPSPQSVRVHGQLPIPSGHRRCHSDADIDTAPTRNASVVSIAPTDSSKSWVTHQSDPKPPPLPAAYYEELKLKQFPHSPEDRDEFEALPSTPKANGSITPTAVPDSTLFPNFDTSADSPLRFTLPSREISPFEFEFPKHRADETEESLDSGDFQPVDGSFGPPQGHEMFIGRSLSTILEADSQLTSMRLSTASADARAMSFPKTATPPSPALPAVKPRSTAPARETLALLEAQKQNSAALAEQLAAAQAVIEHLTDEVEKHKERQVVATSDAEDREARIDSLEGKVEALEEALEQAHTAMSLNEEAVDRLQEEREALGRKHELSSSGSRRDSTDLRAEVEKYEAELRARDEEMEGLHLLVELEKRDREKEVGQARLEVSDMDSELIRLRDELESAQYAASEALNAKATVEEENQALQQDNLKLAEENAQLVQDRMDAMEERDRALGEIDILSFEVTKKTRSADATREELETTQKKLRNLERRMAYENDELEEKLDTAEREVKEYKQRAWQLEEVIVKRLEDRIATLTDLLETAEAGSEHEEELSRSSNTSHTLILQEQELINMRHDLADRKEELEETRHELSRRQREADRELDRLREDLDLATNRLMTVNDDLRQATEEREMHRQRANDYFARHNNYLQELERGKLREAEMKAKIEVLERQSTRDTLTISELRKKIVDLAQDRDLYADALQSKEFELELERRGKKRQPRPTPRPSAQYSPTKQPVAATPTPGVVSHLSPSSKDAVRLRVKKSPPPVSPTKTPKPLSPTARHNAGSLMSLTDATPRAKREEGKPRHQASANSLNGSVSSASGSESRASSHTPAQPSHSRTNSQQHSRSGSGQHQQLSRANSRSGIPVRSPRKRVPSLEADGSFKTIDL